MSMLDEVVDHLRGLSRDQIAPKQAVASLQALRQRHDARIELVWEKDPYSQRVHYDALVCGESETLSISVCPDTGVPWPLRGLQRWSDSDLLQVDGRVLTIQDAVDLLDLAWDEERLLTKLVEVAILAREKDARGIGEPGPEELQQAIDDFRQSRGLYTVEATERWLSEHGLTLERLEAALADRLIRQSIRDQVLADTVELPLEGFDLAVVTAVDLEDPAGADSLANRAREGSLLEEARRLVLRDRRAAVQLAETLRRRDLPAALAQAIVDGRPGAVVGPFAWKGRSRVVEIVSVQKAQRGEETLAAMRELRFADWLAERRSRAHVSWSWGKQASPGAAGPGSQVGAVEDL